MHYIMGLDIGIASIGWAVLETDQDGELFKIADLGVRIFPAAENPKDGSSLALPRRGARTLRRRLQRKAHRKERLKLLFERTGLISKVELEEIFERSGFASFLEADKMQDKEKDVYTLRSEGLDRPLSNTEWARVLYNLSQRRGYRSTSKAEEEANKKGDDGKLLTAVKTNEKRMESSSYRTFGEMLGFSHEFTITDGSGKIVGRKVHNSPNHYDLTASRILIEEEAHKLFAAQRQLDNAFATEAIENDYCAILLSQRHFTDGPGGRAHFNFDLRGVCTFENKHNGFEKDELRSFKACYTFEYFKLLEDINHIKIVPQYSRRKLKQIDEEQEPVKAERYLTAEERAKIIALCMQNGNLDYSRLRKELQLADDERFNRVTYEQPKPKKKKKGEAAEEAAQPEVELSPEQLRLECEKKTKFKQMQSYHEIRKALHEICPISKFSPEQLDQIGEILSLYKADDKRIENLEKVGLTADEIKALLSLTFTKAGSLSLVAMRKLIPYLELGLTYDKACEKVYGDHRAQYNGERQALLHFGRLQEDGALSSINNPVVLRSISQTLKVVNAIIRTYGPPQAINIELARDMKRNFKDRGNIEKQQKENWDKNERARAEVEEIKGSAATGQDIVKMKLYKEQDGRCLYSGRNFDISRLFEVGYAEVDHIIPYSKSFDDSYSNKVLVFSAENQRKGNRLPLEYMREDCSQDQIDIFLTLADKVRNPRKKAKLTKFNLTPEDLNEWKNRNLTDTQYITKATANILRNYLEFEADSPFIKKPVRSINGSVTDQVRKRLGLNKVREDGDLHHALDAAVIAASTDSYINKITRYTQRRELGKRFGRYKDKQTGQTIKVEKKWDPVEEKKLIVTFIDPETQEPLSQKEFDDKYAPVFPAPWPDFAAELKARLSPEATEAVRQLYLPAYGSQEVKPIFVSQMPRRKSTGAAHAETIRSARLYTDEKGQEQRIAVIKTPLTSLKLNKDGEIENYYMPQSDRRLYEELKRRLVEAKGNAEEAFKEEKPVFKPKKDGSLGPRVYKVKTYKPTTSNVKACGGIADNGGMVRIDVFYIKEGKDQGYYFVPIYVADTVKEKLPQKAVVANKSMDNWKEMDDRDFIFSLYPGDLVKIIQNKGINLASTNGNDKITVKELLAYYNGSDISTGRISITNHDRSYEGRSGVKTLGKMEKYEVDVLGNCYKVKLPEKRQTFRKPNL